MKQREKVTPEQYEEALKDAQKIYERAVANPPEKSLIEKQIEESANFLTHSKTMKNRDRDMDRAFSALLAASGRLLEIVQNQQRQIEELQIMKYEFDDLMSGFRAVEESEEIQRELRLKSAYKEGEL